VIIGSIAITLVTFANSYSMAKILAHRVGYTVDANQELLAQVRNKDFKIVIISHYLGFYFSRIQQLVWLVI
jgi:hypothetical protein